MRWWTIWKQEVAGVVGVAGVAVGGYGSIERQRYQEGSLTFEPNPSVVVVGKASKFCVDLEEQTTN